MLLLFPSPCRVLRAMTLGRALTVRAMLCKACKGGLSVRLRCHVIITSYETVILVTSVSEHYLVLTARAMLLGRASTAKAMLCKACKVGGCQLGSGDTPLSRVTR